MRVFGALKDIGHGVLVALYDKPGLILMIPALISVHDGYDIVERDVVALNTDGALNGSCLRKLAQLSSPTPRFLHNGVPQIVLQRLDAPYNLNFPGAKRARLK